MAKLVRFLAAAACFAASFCSLTSYAQQPKDWPQFLGPERNGVSSETGLIDEWPAEGPPEVWRAATGGIGMSGLAISRGKLITLIQSEGRQHVVCFDAENGKPIWKTDVAPEYLNPQGDGPRATPTIAGDRVFVYTGQGILVALSFDDGRILWSRNSPAESGGEAAEYGMSCSPLVVGERVVVSVGAPSATFAAYDIATGEPAWTAGKRDPAGYSSPILSNAGGKAQIVAVSGATALGIDPETGTSLWTYPFVTDYGCNTASPVAVDGKILISSGENHGSVLLKLTPTGKGFDASPVWSSYGPESVLRSEWQTPVALAGHLYGFDNVGGAGPVTHLTGVDPATGTRAWQEIRFGKGNLIAADGKLLISTMKGEFVVVKATPDRFVEIGRKTVLGPTRQAPALASGRVYLRDDQEIVCLDVRNR